MSLFDGTKEHWAEECKEYLDALIGEDSGITSFKEMKKFDLKRLTYFLAEVKREHDAVKAAFAATKKESFEP